MELKERKYSENEEKKDKKCSVNCVFIVFEILFLSLVILVICALYQIPTFLFIRFNVTPIPEIKNFPNCSSEGKFDEICQNEIVTRELCYSHPEFPGVVNISFLPTSQQRLGTEGFNLFIKLLPLLSPSKECIERVVPSFCLQAFGLCDNRDNGNLTMSLKTACFEIRDDVCAREWSTAVDLLLKGELPTCEKLPDIDDECTDRDDGDVALDEPDDNTMMTSLALGPECGGLNSSEPCDNGTSELVCAEGFYLDRNGTNLCRPLCEGRHTLFAVVILLGSMVLLMLFCVPMFIISFTTQRDKLLVFPSILLVYLCMEIFIYAFIFIVGFFDNPGFFCDSMDMIYTLGSGNETTFCIISGFVFQYGLEQMAVWRTIHSFFLYWAVAHPFSYRRFKSSGKMIYAHITSILLALIIPLPAGLVPLRDGYRTEPMLALFTCDTRNSNAFFYSFILPISILASFSNSFVVLTLWKIVKEFVLKKLMANRKVEKVTRAQIKLLIILIYYVINGVFGIANVTYTQLVQPGERRIVYEYFVCESTGSKDCHLERSLDAIRPLLIIFNVIIFTCMPLFIFIFSVDFRKCKREPKKDSSRKISALSA